MPLLWVLYGRECLVCGDPSTTADHVWPLVHGGPDEEANTQPLCVRCNQIKHEKDLDYRPVPFPQALREMEPPTWFCRVWGCGYPAGFVLHRYGDLSLHLFRRCDAPEKHLYGPEEQDALKVRFLLPRYTAPMPQRGPLLEALLHLSIPHRS